MRTGGGVGGRGCLHAELGDVAACLPAEGSSFAEASIFAKEASFSFLLGEIRQKQ